MGEKIWLSMHPINFGYDKIVRTYAEVKFRISSTPHVSALNCMATNTNFNVNINMKNRERARARNKKQRRSISWEEKHKNFIAAVRK